MRSDDTCCSVPMFLLTRFESLKEWAGLFNEACCKHDDRYRGLLPGSWSREIADTMFLTEMQKIATKYGAKHGDKAGFLAFLAAKDFYEAVRVGGGPACRS